MYVRARRHHLHQSLFERLFFFRPVVRCFSNGIAQLQNRSQNTSQYRYRCKYSTTPLSRGECGVDALKSESSCFGFHSKSKHGETTVCTSLLLPLF